MATLNELERFLTEPREDLDVEYKAWLDLSQNAHKAVLAKAAIALANHGGGFIVLGFSEDKNNLLSEKKPTTTPEITQDNINAAIARYAAPVFHAQAHMVTHPETLVTHPVIAIPGTLTEPVMSTRDCDNVIAQAKCYIRKPGPKSEEPRSPEEWRALLNRCVRAGRDDMLEAIRSIVTGRIENVSVEPSAINAIDAFRDKAFERWKSLSKDLPTDSPALFPNGFYEFSAILVGATPADGLTDLQAKLATAQGVQLTGWTPFLRMSTQEWSPYPFGDLIEAWVGRPAPRTANNASAYCDFWQASQQGELYTLRGYSEDSLDERPKGQLFDVTLPIWRIGECILFTARLAKAFNGVSSIAIRCRFTGLQGRTLTSITGLRMMSVDRKSQTDEILLTTEVSLEQIDDNLAEVLHQLLRPLYEKFAFFPLSMQLVEQELAKLTSRNA